MANFWAAALGYQLATPKHSSQVEEELDEGSWLDDPELQRPRICFLRVPEPKAVKNRVHLDLNASDGPTAPLDRRKAQVDAEVDRMLGLGASRLAAYEETDHYHVVMQDPEGNEFCLR